MGKRRGGRKNVAKYLLHTHMYSRRSFEEKMKMLLYIITHTIFDLTSRFRLKSTFDPDPLSLSLSLSLSLYLYNTVNVEFLVAESRRRRCCRDEVAAIR